MTELPSSLVRLESLWSDAGMDVAAHFAPGNDPESIAAILQDAGLAGRGEIVEWFSWHDGAGPNRRVGSPLGPSGWSAFSLNEALEERESRLVQAQSLAADMGEGTPASHWWAPSWLPLAENGGPDVLAVDLGNGRDTADVRNVGWEDPESFPTIWAPSIKDAVDLWIGLLETRNWAWSPTSQSWQGDQATLPRDLRVLMLM